MRAAEQALKTIFERYVLFATMTYIDVSAQARLSSSTSFPRLSHSRRASFDPCTPEPWIVTRLCRRLDASRLERVKSESRTRILGSYLTPLWSGNLLQARDPNRLSSCLAQALPRTASPSEQQDDRRSLLKQDSRWAPKAIHRSTWWGQRHLEAMRQVPRDPETHLYQ